jgi:hypothetical protein
MSFKWSDIRWGRVILGTVLAFIIAAGGSMLVQVFYGLVRGFQLRGAPPREVLVAFAISPTNLVIGLVLTALGALIGGRVAARRVEAGWQFNGLVTGVLTAVLRAAWDVMQYGFTFWTVLHVVLAILLGWLGGLWASRRVEPEYD